MTLAVPRDVEVVRFERDGRAVPTSLLDEGDHKVLTDAVVLSPGTTATWRLRYRLPLEDGAYHLKVVPQPLAVDAGSAVTVRAADGLRLAPRGPVRRSGPLDATVEVDVRAVRPSLVQRVSAAVGRFWREPVRLP